MVEVALDSHLAHERSHAIRALLRHPLLDSAAAPDEFRLVARHRGWLIDWFETTVGWALAVDVAAGFARLGKRAAYVDERRPLLRTRGAASPFDRRRYQLLCLACAELVRHPVTTVGLLAGAITAEASLDTSKHGERAAFVDALRALVDWGALRTSAGEVDAFLDSEHGNALLTADTACLHRLLTSATAPSTLPDCPDGLDAGSATAALLAEPRYGAAASRPEDAEEEQRLRWVRHTVARRLLDDPVAYFDELTDAERDYLANPSGRRWVRERVAEAGFELEERRDGLLVVDPDGIATDRFFPAPHGNAHQLALLLVEHLLVDDGTGAGRRSNSLGPAELRRAVIAILDRFPGWARSHREDDGPDRLAGDAVGLLVDLGLARVGPDGSVTALAALARYRAGEAVHRTAELGLFDELELL